MWRSSRGGAKMTGQAIRAWQCGVLLQLLSATALTCAQAQPTAAGAGVLGSASSHANGSYLGSQLMPPKSEGSCPPDIGPMYEASAIVTGTDMRQRPWGFAKTLRDVLVRSSGDPRLKDDRAQQTLPSMQTVLSPASTTSI